MKFYLSLLAVFALSQTSWAALYNITCYYDTFSITRGGYANFTESDLKTSLEYCTHIVYGYVGLKPGTFDIGTLHSRQHQQFSQVKQLKSQYRHIKFLLSLGGGKDLKSPDKYMKLLETSGSSQQKFATAASKFLRKYKFDGLDLAYQFPQTPFKKQSKIKNVLNKATDLVKKNSVFQKAFGGKKAKKTADNTQSVIQKQQFTTLINRLKGAFKQDKLLLTLTILPHVNESIYIDIPAVINDVDFINLGTYDYATPQRSPREADFLAPLQAPPRSNKHALLRSNIDTDVRKLLSRNIYANKLNLGIATYGRAWKMTKELKSTIMPVTSSLDGPASGGELTHTPGLLSWTEMCSRLEKMSKTKDKKYGNYAYRSASVKGHEGLFITYEDRESLEEKAEYVKRTSLGGVAIFDLTLDDFRGKCKGDKFPALKAIKLKLH